MSKTCLRYPFINEESDLAWPSNRRVFDAWRRVAINDYGQGSILSIKNDFCLSSKRGTWSLSSDVHIGQCPSYHGVQ